MKKFFSVLLVLALVVSLPGVLGGCKKEQKPLRVLVDYIPMGNEVDDSVEFDFEAFRRELIEVGGPADIELEIVPPITSGDSAERESKLTRIRTEIMAGQGPDIFIMAYQSDSFINNKSLFLMPEKSMELGLFYPLDEFIENAQFMHYDEMIPQIVAAGRSEEYGQVILPLEYTFCTTFFMKDDVPEPLEPCTWQEQAQSEVTAYRAAASQLSVMDELNLSGSLGKIADYKNRKMILTEEELLEHVTRYVALHRAYVQGDLTDLPVCCQTDMKPYFEMDNLSVQQAPPDIYPNSEHIPDLIFGFTQWAEEDEFTMVPMYNTEGGVTATIHSWAAINANCKRGEEAFFVLDYLFGKYYESTDPTPFGVYSFLAGRGVPVYKDMMRKENPVLTTYASNYHWRMNDTNFAEFERVRGQINCVRFYDTLDEELFKLYSDAEHILIYNGSGSIEDTVHEHYTRMKRELSE